MDRFEAARVEAAAWHAELAASSGRTWIRAADLVELARQDEDLIFVERPTGDRMLRGARAWHDPQSGTIYHEKPPTPEELYELIGHELGHVKLHTGSGGCGDRDVDVVASIEASPVGVQKVEAYGAREQDELQANVFAREFLLPRTVARQLYLVEGLTASDIARQLGLRLDLVRQQVLDALLLPIPTAAAEERGPSPPLSPAQQDAVEHRGTPYMLEAGPGTGKTRALVARILDLLREDVDPASILALTFSNKAARELIERIGQEAPEAAAQIRAGTFHAFGLELIRKFYDRMDLPPDPPVIDRSDAIELLEEVLPTLPLVHYRNIFDPVTELREMLSAISRAKDEIVDAGTYRTLAQRMLDRAGTDDEREAAEQALEVAQVYEAYERLLRERQLVDFGDLIMRPTVLVENDAELREMLRQQHRHVLVDEYQDVNRASGRLLKALTGSGERLWVVGDARQSVYRFRGASPANIRLFAEEFPGTLRRQLDRNHRSVREIVDTFVAFSREMGASAGMLPLALEARRGAGVQRPQLRRCLTRDHEEAATAVAVRELEAAGIALRDQAVLCRSNAKLNTVAHALERAGIPILYLGSLFERDEVRNLLALLSLFSDPYGSGLVRVAALPRYGVPLQDVHAAIGWLKSQDERAFALLGRLPDVPGLSSAGRAGFTQLAADLSGFVRSARAWDVLTTYLLDRTDVVRSLARAESVSDRLRALAIWQFMNFVREQPLGGSPGTPIGRLLGRVRRLTLLAEERDLRQVPTAAQHMDAVRLMTVHASKGLEFRAVHLPGLNTQSFPLNARRPRCAPPDGMIAGTTATGIEATKAGYREEEECLFFVAVSRARDRLILYAAQTSDGIRKRGESSFLSKIAGHIETVVVPLRPDAVPALEAIRVTYPTGWTIEAEDIIAYDRCPLRYFYTRVLGLAGARETGAFSKTHDCVYGLLSWLAEQPVDSPPPLASAMTQFDAIWAERGPVDHAFGTQYRGLADQLIRSIFTLREGLAFHPVEQMGVDLQSGRVAVTPDEIASLSNGTIIMRRLRTGRRRSDEQDRVEYALYLLAGRGRYPRLRIDAVHLTEGQATEITIPEKKLQNQRQAVERMLADMTAGRFPPEPRNELNCPRCPHFFICPGVPPGRLTIAATNA